MNLIIDIGNTLVKLAIFDKNEIVLQHSMEHRDTAMLDVLLNRYPTLDKAIICSTRGDCEELIGKIRSRMACCLEFTAHVAVPISNAYLTPATLGRDRLAAAVGASVLHPSRNVLVVDFGTALTIDLVTADGTFRGGVISPGMNTRFRALHHYTAQLPLCEATEEILPLGNTTATAIEQGVMNGIAFEIEGYIDRMSNEFADLCIIFTGGDAKYFVKRIKNTIFANYNLVLYGLNRILEYNTSEENPT
ncbi:MAG: type III pantothenate kinase [Alistipes sp.]